MPTEVNVAQPLSEGARPDDGLGAPRWVLVSAVPAVARCRSAVPKRHRWRRPPYEGGDHDRSCLGTAMAAEEGARQFRRDPL